MKKRFALNLMDSSAWAWLKRRWFDFRVGHGTYLSLLLGFINFLLISYNLLIERLTFLKMVFPHLWVFAIVGILTYTPVTILIGHFHVKKQLQTDITVQAIKNPYYAEIVERLERIEKMLNTKKEMKGNTET